MKGYFSNIEKESKENNNFRKVLYTGKFMQLVVMSIDPGGQIGEEVHDNVDQFFRIEEGSVKFIVDGQQQVVGEEEVFIVPAGSVHNVLNESKEKKAKLYTIYAPPNHPEGTVHKTYQEALKAEEEHHH